MISKQRLRLFLLIVVALVGLHFLTTNNFRNQDLQRILDESLNKKPESYDHKQPSPGKDIPAKTNQQINSKQQPDSTKVKLKPKPKNPKLDDYTIFFDDLEKYKINQPSIKGKYKEKDQKAKELFSTEGSFLFNKEYLENVLDISETTFEEMKASHTKYVNERIPQLLNEGVVTFGKMVPSDPDWEIYEGSSGYVLVGGGRYSWLSYLVIKQIRATGAQLPIELFLATEDDYEKSFCEHILRTYNARCNVFDKKLAEDLSTRFNIGGYQYKMLALLSSRFENVLYLDSDNFPTRNVDYIFDSDLYKKNNLILWPDAWARTTNPMYYDIANVEVKENKLRYSAYDVKQAGGKENLRPLSEFTFENSWFHDFEGTLPDPTSETGMFVVNKTSHLKTLLLCLYYNVFGPDYYYPILTQGSAGEGDKETFIAAAHALNEPWHQTLKQFQWTGYHSKASNSFTSKALAHYDPVQASTDTKGVDIIFMHLSYPKFYPNWLVDNHDLVYQDSGEHIRMYAGVRENVGYDFDLRVLQFFTESICPNYYGPNGKAIDEDVSLTKGTTYMGDYLQYIKDEEQNNIKRCEEVFIPHLKWLKETNNVKETKKDEKA
ncbi:Mnn2 alpha-1,2-mannosyltransferase [Candida orthopsilosis Co 90-125]|uniref:Mnn2 alpha-1,2-mannosyltransferase n=1 Tax=Candida orthopsilosis (strain 90-125) TaxID=1136231 RepID=H8X537_CANO9|nr:Mnn2 alpha-1,2-mannosyltransferase [Candida orthopsilosis Co 90-125]CCG23130.1 Mnn2 alpha-1,2-mannosyltransferase [Candida orthopsilosis Co 90-125]